LLPLELLGAPEGSRLVHAVLDLDTLTIDLATATPTAACPLCGSDTRRVHSRYTRRLDDLPCLGLCMRLRIAVRRFVCQQPDCPRRIFAERLPGFAAPRARATDRLRQAQTAIGSSLGGEAGSRLAARMGITASPNTLLRVLARLLRKYTLSDADQAPVDDVLAVEQHVVPLDGADVLEQGDVDPLGLRAA
jgi:hypothetical protein